MNLVSIATGALLAKDLIGSKKSNRSSGTKKGGSKGIGTFGKIVLAVGGAYVANKLIASYSKSSVQDEAGNGTKDGNAAAFALQLYEALNGGFLDLGWGTDEDVIIQVANQVKAQGINDLVIEKYRALYNRSLNNDLTSDGVFITYYNIINGVTPAKNNTGGTSDRQLTKGATIYGRGGYNIRTIYGAVVRMSIAGEAWQIVNWKTETYGGTNGIWVEVKKKDINIVTTYKIFVKGLYFKP